MSTRTTCGGILRWLHHPLAPEQFLLLTAGTSISEIGSLSHFSDAVNCDGGGTEVVTQEASIRATLNVTLRACVTHESILIP
jgi:hypothetical protein